MGHGREQGRWFTAAHKLAQTGRYRNVAEVEAALKAREPEAVLSESKVLRGLIDGTCSRSRRTKRWS